MNEQQKLLQSILAEVGISLTDNQMLAVIDAVSLSCKSPVPYHEVMEFKEKYVPNKIISIEDANKIVSNACSYLASHYNENNQPER